VSGLGGRPIASCGSIHLDWPLFAATTHCSAGQQAVAEELGADHGMQPHKENIMAVITMRQMIEAGEDEAFHLR
jgi:hypothetical protein